MCIDQLITKLTNLKEGRENAYRAYVSIKEGRAFFVTDGFDSGLLRNEEVYEAVISAAFEQWKRFDDIVKMIEQTNQVDILTRLEL